MQSTEVYPLRGRPVVAGIIAGMVAMAVTNILPLMVSVVADQMALSSFQAGLIASSDIAGLALGSVLCALLRGRSLRTIGVGGLAVLTIANVVTMSVQQFELLIPLRFVAGLGGGFALAVCYAVLAAGDQARDFSYFNIGQVAIGWAALVAAPTLLAHAGWQGIFGSLAVLGLVAALAGLYLPHHILRTERVTRTSSGRSPARRVGYLAVLAIFLYFVGQAAVWTYIDRMAALRGFAGDDILIALSWCVLAGIAASVLTGWLDLKLGLVVPLIVGLVLTGAGNLSFWYLPTLGSFILAGSLFLFGWNVIVPYQFAAVAKVDEDGLLAMLASTGSVAGIAVGPAIAAPFAANSDYGAVRLLALGLVALSMALLVPAVRLRGTSTSDVDQSIRN
jgi:MFS transporter, DHA1 family, inner membrane transport protein